MAAVATGAAPLLVLVLLLLCQPRQAKAAAALSSASHKAGRRAASRAVEAGKHFLVTVPPRPAVDFCEVDPMQTESLACKIVFARSHYFNSCM